MAAKRRIQFFAISILLFMSCLSFGQSGQKSNIEDFTITITFVQPPATMPQVVKAPLKYNKDFALILQMDDSNPAVHDQVMPFFKGQQGNPGLYYTEGNPQNFQAFKMDAVHFSFNGLGQDMHNYVNGYLHWDNLINLWAGEFGLVNHGVADPPTNDYELDIRRNLSYTKRKTLSGTIPGGYDMDIYVVPNNIAGHIPIAKQHHLVVYHDGINAIQNPARVESLPSIQGVELSRGSITANLFQQVQGIANQSDPNNHYIATFYNHGFGGVDISFEQFKSQMNQIAAAFGKDGSNKIWSATASEVFEYLRLKELITVNTTLNGNVLTITFSGQNIPQNFRYYAMTITVEGESNIINMTVQEPNQLSTYLYNQNKALLNLKWEGRVVGDALVRAQNAVGAAEGNKTPANALTAMDFVQMLPPGPAKDQLRDRLCALSGITYEQGFCPNIPFLGGDTAVCLGSTLQFTAPAAQSYLWSTGQTTQSITLTPTQTMQLWAKATTNGFVVSDTIQIGVLPLPNVQVFPAQAIIDPGSAVQLSATGATSYLWSNGSTGQSITVAPRQSTNYWVKGTDTHGCSASDTASVEVVYTTEVNFTSNTVCFGNKTILTAQVSSNDSILVKEWDLTGNGLFADGSGDQLEVVLPKTGENLVGLRIRTASGAIHTKYNPVIVASYPQAQISTSNHCFGQPTQFVDESTTTVGNIVSRYWSVGDGNEYDQASFTYEYSHIGTYQILLAVTTNYGCSDTARTTLSIASPPMVDLRLVDGVVVNEGQSIVLDKGGSLTFTVNSIYDSIIWKGGSRSRTFRVTSEGVYYVDVYQGGCGVRRNFNVTKGNTPNEPNIEGIMNLFTPNNDGYNDYWVIKDLARISPARVAVYTRAGAQVYQSNDYDNKWNGYYQGNPLPEGTYYYVIEGKDGQIFKGPLSIIR